MRIFVTSVGDSMGIAVIKALEGKNYQLIVGDADSLAPGLYMGKPHIKGRYNLPYANEENYISTVLEICKKESIDVFVPLSEQEIQIVSKNIQIFELNRVNILIPPFSTLELAIDKKKTMDIAEKLNIPYPKTIFINKHNFKPKETIEEMLEKVSFPLIVKPNRGRGGIGVDKVNTIHELKTDLANKINIYQELLIQEYIPGEIGSVYMYGAIYSHSSENKASFVSRSIRTKFKWGGPAIAGESVYNKEMIDYGEKMLDYIKWVGPAGIEFKLDERNGIPKLMEINPRLWGYNYLATGSGINFPELLIQLALGNDSMMKISNYEVGNIMVRLLDDIIIKPEKIINKFKG